MPNTRLLQHQLWPPFRGSVADGSAYCKKGDQGFRRQEMLLGFWLNEADTPLTWKCEETRPECLERIRKPRKLIPHRT